MACTPAHDMIRSRIQRGSPAVSSKVVRSVSSLYLALAVAGLSCDANAVEDAVAATYALSFSDMRVSHHVNQDEPRPDLVVRVRRLDAELEARLNASNRSQRELESRQDTLVGAHGTLERRAGSGLALTSEQRERLDTLRLDVSGFCAESGKICADCPEGLDFWTCARCAKCPELQLLEWHAPLTDDELLRMQELEGLISALSAQIAQVRTTASAMRSQLAGSSSKITTSSKSVRFAGVSVINVHPGDEVAISVWDVDPFFDELYGRTTLVLDRQTLEGGSLVVQTGAVEHLRMGFLRVDEN